MDAALEQLIERDRLRRELHGDIRRAAREITAALADLSHPERIDAFDPDTLAISFGELCERIVRLQSLNADIRRLRREAGGAP